MIETPVAFSAVAFIVAGLYLATSDWRPAVGVAGLMSLLICVACSYFLQSQDRVAVAAGYLNMADWNASKSAGFDNAISWRIHLSKHLVI